MNREQMLKHHLEDLEQLRTTDVACLVQQRAGWAGGYAGAMYHAKMITEAEWRRLGDLRENAAHYAKKGCVL